MSPKIPSSCTRKLVVHAKINVRKQNVYGFAFQSRATPEHGIKDQRL